MTAKNSIVVLDGFTLNPVIFRGILSPHLVPARCMTELFPEQLLNALTMRYHPHQQGRPYQRDHFTASEFAVHRRPCNRIQCRGYCRRQRTEHHRHEMSRHIVRTPLHKRSSLCCWNSRTGPVTHSDEVRKGRWSSNPDFSFTIFADGASREDLRHHRLREYRKGGRTDRSRVWNECACLFPLLKHLPGFKNLGGVFGNHIHRYGNTPPQLRYRLACIAH
jgi:hypothetical protein